MVAGHEESMTSALRVAIIGASGYTSLELLRWLLRHPQAQIAMLVSRKPEQPISEIFPELLGRIELPITPFEPAAIAGQADLVFLCVPHATAMSYVPPLLAAGVRVIDLSADYRLKDAGVYESWYRHAHSDRENLIHAVYGLPDLCAAEIAAAKLVANPGCYPTSAILPLAPLIKAGLIGPQDIIVNSGSGISGAGRNPSAQHHFPERNEAFEAYSIGAHRHAPEMAQALAAFGGRAVDIVFVPHLVPMDRGILSTIYVKPTVAGPVDRALQAWRAAYGQSPFVRIRSSPLPSTKYVLNTNYIDMAICSYGRRWVITSALDNMVKGAAGQAIENMNLMAGYPQGMGLDAKGQK